MDLQPSFVPDMGNGDGVPYYDKHGRALTEEERAKIAKRLGLCLTCHVQTHKRGFMRQPLNNDDVYNGICIRCRPEQVPADVAQAWISRNRRPVVVPTIKRRPHHNNHHHNNHHRDHNNHHRDHRDRNRDHDRPERERRRAIVQPPSNGGSVTVAAVTAVSTVSSGSGHAGGSFDGSNHNSASSMTMTETNAATASSRGSGRFAAIRDEEGSNNSLFELSPPRNPASRHHGSAASLSGSSNALPMMFTPEDMNGSERTPNGVPPQHPQRRGSTEDYVGRQISASDPSQLADLLRNNHGDVRMLIQILHRIRNSTIGDDGVLPPAIVRELKNSFDNHRLDARFMTAASGVVWRLGTLGDATKHQIVVDIPFPATQSLRSNPRDADLAEWALGAMASLANHPKNKVLIAQTGCIEVVLEIMEKQSQVPRVFEWTCRCLHTLVYTHYDDKAGLGMDLDDEIQKSIAAVEESGLVVILQAMKNNFNESVAQWWGMKLLWCLQGRMDERSSVRTRNRMCDNEFLQHANRVIRARSSSGKLFHITSQLVCAMLVSLDEDISRRFEIVKDCVPSVVRLMGESQNRLVQESGCQLLSSLCDGSDEVRRMLKQEEAIVAIITAMERLPTNPAVVECGSWALWTLSTDSSLFVEALIRRALNALQLVFQRQREPSIDFLIPACGFIGNATTLISGTVEVSDVPIGIAIRAFESPSVQDSFSVETCLRAMSKVCIKCPDYVEEFTGALNVDRVGEALHQAPEAVTELLMLISSQSQSARNSLVSAGMLARAAALLRDHESTGVGAETILDLITVLTAADHGESVNLPGDLIETNLMLMRAYDSDSQLLARAFSTLRNLLLASPTRIDTPGLDDFIMDKVNNPATEDLLVEACGALWALAEAKQTHFDVQGLSNMFEAVVGVMARYNPEAVQYRGDVLAAAAGALSSIVPATRFAPIHVDLDGIHAIIASGYKILQSDDGADETLVNLLEGMLHLCHIVEEIMIQSGVVVVVVDVMVRRRTNGLVLAKGCSILASLTSAGNLQVNLGIAETDGIQILTCALTDFPKDAVIASEACKALRHLSDDQETMNTVLEEGGIELAINALNSHQGNFRVLEDACSLLLQLTADQPLLEENMLEALKTTMENHRSPSVLQERCLAILHRTSDIGEGASLMAQQIWVSLIVRAIREYMDTPAVLKHAFPTLGNLAAIEDCPGIIGNADGIAAVVNGILVSVEYEEVQKLGCDCLAAISSCATSKALIRAVGGVEAIAYAMRAHYSSANVLTAGCQAVSNLTADVPSDERATASGWLLGGIVNAMQNFPQLETLQLGACTALCNLLESPKNVSVVREHKDELRPVLADASRLSELCSTLASQILAVL